MVHFVVERDASGMPARLLWSSQIQAEVEKQIAAENARREAERIARERPAQWIEEWIANRPLSK